VSDNLAQDVLTRLDLRLFQLYVLFGRASERWDLESAETQQALARHVGFLRELESSGTMFMGGPFRADDYAWDGSGMIVVRADSLVEAWGIAERDPLFVEDMRSYEVRGWQLNEGRLVLSVDLDSNKVGIS
jgi:uncharacterized protein YciI